MANEIAAESYKPEFMWKSERVVFSGDPFFVNQTTLPAWQGGESSGEKREVQR